MGVTSVSPRVLINEKVASSLLVVAPIVCGMCLVLFIIQ